MSTSNLSVKQSAQTPAFDARLDSEVFVLPGVVNDHVIDQVGSSAKGDDAVAAIQQRTGDGPVRKVQPWESHPRRVAVSRLD